MPRKESTGTNASASAPVQRVATSDGIDNYELPKSLVTRLAKRSIPDNTKLQKDTVSALVKGSTVFINYLGKNVIIASAHDIASSRQHKSVSASDVLKALETLQFKNMIDVIQPELQIYRENVKSSKKGTKSGEPSSAKSKTKVKGKEKASVADNFAAPPTGMVQDDEEMVDVDNIDRSENDDDDDDEGEEEDELIDDAEDEEHDEPEDDTDRMAVDDETAPNNR